MRGFLGTSAIFFENPLQNTPKGYIIEIVKYPYRVFDTHHAYEREGISMGEAEKNCCRYKSSPRSPETLRQLQNRLSRIAGQLGGISKMLEENRYCGDILTQVAAVESALQSFGYTVLQEHMETCVAEGVRAGDMEILEEALGLIKKLK